MDSALSAVLEVGAMLVSVLVLGQSFEAGAILVLFEVVTFDS